MSRLIKYAFIGLAILFVCGGIVQADVSGDFTYTTTSTSAEIIGYSGPSDLIIPETLGEKPVKTIKHKVFYGRNLTSAFIPASVTSIGNFNFAKCSQLTSITVDSNNSTFSSNGGVLFNKNKTTLIQFPGGKTGAYTIPTGVTTLGYSAFSGCSITGVVLSASVSSADAKYSFSSDELLSITVDKNNTIYSSEGGVLFNKTKTSLVQYPDGRSGFYDIPLSVTSIEAYAFEDAYLLSGVTIPSSVTHIKDDAFKDCYNLENVIIPPSVSYIGPNVFSLCDSLVPCNI